MPGKHRAPAPTPDDTGPWTLYLLPHRSSILAWPGLPAIDR
jgi:hypothetical protein